jgi:hypothetical protein
MPLALTIQPNFAKLAGAAVKMLQFRDREGRLEIAMILIFRYPILGVKAGVRLGYNSAWRRAYANGDTGN